MSESDISSVPARPAASSDAEFEQWGQVKLSSPKRWWTGRKPVASTVEAEANADLYSQKYSPVPIARFNPPLEHWYAQFAVRVGGYFAWLTTCPSGKSVLFRYTSHLVILLVLIGTIGLVSTAQATRASDLPERQATMNLLNSASPPAGSTADVNYNLLSQNGPIMADQIFIAPQANPYTMIPSRERRGVITYTVQAGDTLFGIAGQFGLRPESVLWANYDALQDNPHLLQPGMDLAIPPVNGIVYTVEAGDTVESIAEKYKVTPDAIYVDGAQWNQLKPGDQPAVGETLIIPGGSREFKPWALTAAQNMPQSSSGSTGSGTVVARGNIGACGSVAGGLVGTGNFIWPTPKHWVSGNNYAAWHPGIDIAANLGDSVYAADNGVVVYAGWNSWGYGNLVVIDHGNGWQTWYAHNSEIYVTCGQNVHQGSVISAAGSTGHSTGPHVHFETRFNGTIPNPYNVLPPP